MDYQKDLTAEFDREIARTRKVLEAIPDGVDFDFKPHPKSMALGRLAGHLCDFAGDWAIDSLRKDKLEFGPDHKWEPFVPRSREEILAKFDSKLPAVHEALAATTPEKWDRNWQFVWGGQTIVDQPRHQVFREMVMSHMIHHRAQMGVYLRLLGAKVPGVYGPSADEM